MDDSTVINPRQYKQFYAMLTFFNNGFELKDAIFPNLYVFQHPDSRVVDKVLLIDEIAMEYYEYMYD
jgi:hypothetical protein